MRGALTPRALVVGLVLVVGLSLAAPYVGLMMRSQLLATNYYPVGLGASFLGVVLILNVVLKSLRRSWALRQGELAIVFVMAAVGITMPTHGTAGYLLSIISAPHYLASPTNRYAECFFPYLRPWSVVAEGPALRWFWRLAKRANGSPFLTPR